MNMVSPPWTTIVWHFMFGLCESLVLFLGRGLCLEMFVFPGVSSLKIGQVNEHGQPPWTKIVWHFMLGLCESFGCFWGWG